MKQLNKGLYTITNSSINVRILKIYYRSDKKIVAKLSFEYKNGAVIEVKSHKLVLDKIQHWRKVYV